MKRRYREKALNDLLDRMNAEDFDQREHGLFQLALMLRRANRHGSTQELAEIDDDSLPRNLRRIHLSAVEQRQIVQRLLLLAASRRESRATVFWALGGAEAVHAWAPTLALLEDCGAQLEREAAYQICRALRGWLEMSETAAESANARGGTFNLVELARAWATTADDRLGREASIVLELLQGRGR